MPIPTFFLKPDGSGSTWSCRARPCEAEHFLSVKYSADTFVVCYQRYTLRYPLEFYDQGVIPPELRLHRTEHAPGNPDEEWQAGPVIVYPRKKRFSSSDVKTIWQVTRGRCHICRRRWRLNQRGVRGWHIDHVIPHIGGGRDAECLENLRVACAKCNLKKGKGFTEAAIRLGLRELVRRLGRSEVR